MKEVYNMLRKEDAVENGAIKRHSKTNDEYNISQDSENLSGQILIQKNSSKITRCALYLERALKRFLDILISVVGIIICGIVFILLYFKIKKDGGPMFFKQHRVGKNRQLFKIYKLRTMSVDAERKLTTLLKTNEAMAKEYYSTFKLKNDPRVTPIGRILRKTSLDELPQFINVLRGEMSVVGPRPVLEEEAKMYYNSEDGNMVFSVRPGLTGLWQINGRSDITDYAERVRLDADYVKNWSILGDIKIIIKTMEKVARMKGAY